MFAGDIPIAWKAKAAAANAFRSYVIQAMAMSQK
jgi:hypothetical protein